MFVSIDTTHPAGALRRGATRLALATALVAALLAGLQQPAEARPPQEQLSQATRTLERAMNGDDSAIGTAADLFADLLAKNPSDPLVMSYAGASTALRANATWMPWRKMSFAEDGLALIDKSLAMLTAAHDAPVPGGVPVGLETRFVAASTFLSLPGMFNRRTRGERLLGEVVNSPLLAATPVDMRGAVWLRAGLTAAEDKRMADARTFLQRVIDANAPQASAARAKLQEIGR